jgi:autotransporter passenger strand-loop-strand repeat protein
MSIDYVGVTVDVNTTGPQILYSGDTATDTTITAGTYQRISSGGKATITTINGGSQRISGGSATSTTISSAYQEVSGTTINSGGSNESQAAAQRLPLPSTAVVFNTSPMVAWPNPQTSEMVVFSTFPMVARPTPQPSAGATVVDRHHTTINGGSQRLKRRHSVLH